MLAPIALMLLLSFLMPNVTHCADRYSPQKLGKYLIAMVLYDEKIIHNKPIARWSHNLDVETVNTLYNAVNAQDFRNKEIADLIDVPRTEIVERHKEYDMKKETILLNGNGDWIGFSTDPHLCNFYYGNYYTQSLNAAELFIHAPHTIQIRSLDTEYWHHKNKWRGMFLVLAKETIHKNFLILPNIKTIFNITFIANAENRNCLYLQKTCKELLQTIFAFSKHVPTKFWYPKFDCNNLSIVVGGKLWYKDLMINLNDQSYQDILHNKNLVMQAASFFKEQPCGCTTGSIDPKCQEHYQKLCTILEEESATQLLPDILKSFASFHILHEIENNKPGEDSDVHYYTNPYAGLVAKKDGIITQLDDNTQPIDTLDQKTLEASALAHAQDWKRNRDLLCQLLPLNQHRNIIKFPAYFYDGSKKIKLNFNSIEPSVNETILDTHYLHTKNNQLYYFFATKNESNNTNVLHFVNITDNRVRRELKTYACQTCNLLKQGLHAIVLTGKDHGCSITAPYKAINEFMQYIRSFEDNTLKMPEKPCFIDSKNLFTEWIQKGTIPFKFSADNILSFPNRFYKSNDDCYQIKNRYHLCRNEELEDTEYVVANKNNLLLLITTKNRLTGQYRVFFLHNYYESNPQVKSFSCTTSAELWSALDITIDQTKQYKKFPFVIDAPAEAIQTFMQELHKVNHTPRPYISPTNSNSNNPLLACNLDPHINPLSLQMLKDKTCYIKPNNFFERIFYGISIIKTNKDALCSDFFSLGGSFLLLTSTIADYHPTHPMNYLTNKLFVGLLGTCSASLPFALRIESTKSFVWPVRLTAFALSTYLCKTFFTNNPLLQTGFSLLPMLNLILYAYEVNKEEYVLQMPFADFYNSWPALLHRTYKKIALQLSTKKQT